MREEQKQMPDEKLVEVKFRLPDGSDIGPFHYSPASTVANLKERVVAEWPKEKEFVPRTADELKLINAGKILENNKSVAQCMVPFEELANAVVTFHAVVQPTYVKGRSEKKVDKVPQKNACSCAIL